MHPLNPPSATIGRANRPTSGFADTPARAWMVPLHTPECCEPTPDIPSPSLTHSASSMGNTGRMNRNPGCFILARLDKPPARMGKKTVHSTDRPVESASFLPHPCLFPISPIDRFPSTMASGLLSRPRSKRRYLLLLFTASLLWLYSPCGNGCARHGALLALNECTPLPSEYPEFSADICFSPFTCNEGLVRVRRRDRESAIHTP